MKYFAGMGRAFSVLLLFLGIGLAVRVGYVPAKWWALLVAGWLLLHGAISAIEFLLSRWANRHDVRHPVRAIEVCRAACTEALCSVRVFYWDQPLRGHAWPDVLSSPAQQRAIVMVHGLLCNRGFWNPWLRRLQARGIPCIAVNVPPVRKRIEEGVEAVELAVQRAIQATGLAPVIVAHSMGGLWVRAWLRTQATDGRVHHIITIGSPHQGTALARYAFRDVIRSLRAGSPWLQQLAADEPSSRHRLFTCFYGHCDNIVFPVEVATLPGADNRHLRAVGHIQMAYRTEVFEEALRWLFISPEQAVLLRRPGPSAG